MQILLYGETKIIGSGAWCYAKSFISAGYDLIEFSNDAFLMRYYSNIFWKIFRYVNRKRFLERHRTFHVNELLELVQKKKPDIIIVLKGLYLSKEDIEKMKKHSAFVVNINHDDFFSLNTNNRSNLQFKAIGAYDYIFVTREVNVAEIYPLNKNVEFFPFSYHPEIHFRHELSADDKKKYDVDILFIGTYEKQRATLLELVAQKTNYSMAIYGGSWHLLPKNSILHKYIKSYKGLMTHEMAKAIQCAKISLGFLRKANRDTYTQRTFEIPSSGGVLLAERTNFHQTFFEEGVEAAFFDPDNHDELLQKIDFLMKNVIVREQIRESGFRKVINSSYTYNDRIAQIIRAYKDKQKS